MATDLPIRCECGKLRGTLRGVDGTRGTHRGAYVVDVPLHVISGMFRIRHVPGNQDGSPRRRAPFLVPRLDRLAQPRDADADAAPFAGDVTGFQGHEQTGKDPRALRRDARDDPGGE